MRCCLRLNRRAGHSDRSALSWRAARAFCVVWFLLTSIGLPFNLPQTGEKTCARNPGAQCRCSLKKRLSGTCCCGRDAGPQLAKSCCSVKKSQPKLPEPIASACCSPKGRTHERSISRCDCGSESPENISLDQEPRLPVLSSRILWPQVTAAFVVLPADRVESAQRLPPVPPPKVVLS